MQTISAGLATEINDGSQMVKARATATWADSKVLDNLLIYSTAEKYSTSILEESPILYARMNDASGTTALDSSSNARDGVYQGSGHVYQYAGALAGEPSDEAHGQGTSGWVQYTEATHGTVFRMGTDFTVSMFISLTATDASTRYVICKAVGTSSTQIEWAIRKTTANALAFVVWNTGGSTFAANGPTLVADTWYHVVGVKTGNVLTLYVNGNLVGTSSTITGTPTTTTGDLAIGRLGSAASGNWNGRYDEVALFNKALSADKIKALYEMSTRVDEVPVATYFDKYQAFNGKQRSSMRWGVTDALDERGNVIVTDAGFKAIDSVNDNNYEYGWWSRTKSNGSGNFTNPEYLLAKFSTRKANYIEVITSEHYGRIKTYTLSYFTSTGVEVTVATNATFPKTSYSVEHSLGSVVDITGVKVSISATHEASQPARIQELNPIYRTEITDDIIDVGIIQERENYDTTVPFGITSANIANILLDNTSKTYNVFGSNVLAPYIRKEVKIDIDLGWNISGTYEYVRKGTFYVDDWAVSTDSMTISANLRDSSRFLQEEPMAQGYFYENETAARAIVDLARINGIPYDKIRYTDTWENTVINYRPFAFYRMNDVIGQTTALDKLQRYNGTYTGGPSLGTAGKVTNDSNNFAVSFDGSDDYVLLPTIPNPSTWTVGCWIYSRSSADAASHGVFGNTSGTNNGRSPSLFVFNGTQLTYGMSNGTWASDTTAAGTISINTWHFITMTYDGANIRIYVDGVEKDFLAMTGNSAAPISVIGQANSTFFNGIIDEFFVMNYALTATEVVNIFQASNTTKQEIYPYLYDKDQTPWDAMLEIATADVGMFYFDEQDVFTYESGYHLHETIPLHTHHSAVQFDLDDSTNIISGDHVIELQANKVIVNVNSKTTMGFGIQSIWRAEDNSSLVVTSLSGAHDRKATTINVASTDSPLWPTQGYFKIDNEIIEYTGKTYSSFTGCVRGSLGTSAASHSSGAKVREVRVFDIEYASSPAFNIQQPLITARDFESKVDVELFTFDPFKAKLIVSATDAQNNVGDTIFLEGTDPVTELDYFTAVAGRPIEEKSSDEQVIKQESKNSASVRRYRYKTVEIDNKFIQSKERAAAIAQFILDHFKNPVPIIEVSTLGIPHLQLGDRVRILTFDQLDIVNKDYWIMSIDIRYTGGVDQRMILREVS